MARSFRYRTILVPPQVLEVNKKIASLPLYGRRRMIQLNPHIAELRKRVEKLYYELYARLRQTCPISNPENI